MSVEVPGFADVTPLDRGGFGAVFRATRVSTGGTVALKMLDAGPELDEVVLERRLRREIAALVALKGHPNVVQVEELVIAEAGPVIVMEFMDAGSVAKLVESTSPPVERIAYIGTCLASALAAAHAVGIVHRDVKPHNALMNSYGQVKLCDFGIAAIVRSTEVRTRTTSLSVRYASPEELDDDPDVGPPTDAYSLGATLYHLLHGAPPSFRGRGVPDVDATIVRQGGDPTRQRLGLIIDACLLVNPALRPTAAEVYDLLIELGDAAKQPHRAPPPVAFDHPLAPTVQRVAPLAAPIPIATAVYASTPPECVRSSAGWWAATAVMALLLVGGLIWFVAGRPTTTGDAARSNTSETASTGPDATASLTGEPTTSTGATEPALIVAEVAPIEVSAETTVPATSPSTVPPTAPPTTPDVPAPAAIVSPFPYGVGPTAAAADSMLISYISDATARRYDIAWAQLTPRYQEKYRGYDTFVRFWETVEGGDVRSTQSIGSTATTQTLAARVWFGRRDDGTISNELVDIDFVTGPGGAVFIDDYRFVGNDD